MAMLHGVNGSILPGIEEENVTCGAIHGTTADWSRKHVLVRAVPAIHLLKGEKKAL